MHSTILRRMTGRATGDVAEPPLTSSRAVRLAMTKSANDTVGLILTVMGMAEEVVALDQLLAALDDKLMLIGLQREGILAGIVAVDMQLRAAILEMQTVGKLIAGPAEDRKATGTDKMMCEPVLNAFLQALPKATAGTEFEGWADDAQLGRLIDSSRAAGLVLNDQDYRILRMEVDLDVADRKGLVLLALPLAPVADEPTIEVVPDQDWDARFQAVVSEAPACLDALLHRFRIPLAQAENLRVGQLLPLPGCTVHSVRILAPDGQTVAHAKLGQTGGMRAVRIEAEPMPQLRELGGSVEAGMPKMVGAAFEDDHGADFQLDAAMDAQFANDAPADTAFDGTELSSGLATAPDSLDTEDVPDMSPMEEDLPDNGDFPMVAEPLSVVD